MPRCDLWLATQASGNRYKPSNRMAQLVIFALIITLTAGYCQAASVQNEARHLTYGVIVDCGSSGTRANIYQWNSTSNYVQMLHDIDNVRDAKGKPITKKIKPGLSRMRDSPSGASEYMQPIMDFIFANIPERNLKSTGLYIMATAGMRLLNAEDRLNIINDIIHDLQPQFDKFARVEASVISGAMEGMYEWITVNSKAKQFVTETGTAAQTYGLVEMGGASLQVAYQLSSEMRNFVRDELEDDPEAHDAFFRSIVHPHISRESDEFHYKIMSVTFLGFGGNSAREAYVDLLIMNKRKQRFKVEEKGRRKQSRFVKTWTIEDPCLPSGAVQVMKKPSKMLEANVHKTIGWTLEDENEPSFKVLLVGTSNYGQCWFYLRAMLDIASVERLNCDPSEPCAMSLLGTEFMPHHDFKFLGLGDFYYTTKEMMNQHGVYNRHKVMEKTREICNTSYKDLYRQYPEANKYDVQRILLECFKATWMEVFLTFGLLMPPDEDTFETVGNINGDSIDWTLGAVLDKSIIIEEAAEEQKVLDFLFGF